MSRPTTLGALKREIAAGRVARRPVRSELRENLLTRLKAGGPIFPGVLGYEDTVVPQVVNAILARHHFILLGLRGQAKSRMLRALTALLDDEIPVVPGSEINDDPIAPLSAYGRHRVAEAGDDLPIDWLPRDRRYVEKLATPDVTIADMIGDIDPIKAARGGLALGDELTMHYGLVPRANRGIFAINELPDLAGRIQVGLFNILQEGDVQIKGFPVRLPLDILLVFSANPEDYTARGKIITPLKDRIGSEIRTHYPATLAEGVAITEQEAWTARTAEGGHSVEVPRYVREVVEEIAFQARKEPKVDKRSGVSQRLPISVLENVVSNAERRAVLNDESLAVPRVSDIHAALPAITGKLELEYEGELKGADKVAADIIRAAVGQVFDAHLGQRQPAPGDRMVRPGRLVAARRRRVGRDAARSREAGAGPGRRPRGARPARRCPRAAHRLGDRLRPRRVARPEAHQPHGRGQVHRRRRARPPRQQGRQAPRAATARRRR